jgi:hypothetical protein
MDRCPLKVIANHFQLPLILIIVISGNQWAFPSLELLDDWSISEPLHSSSDTAPFTKQLRQHPGSLSPCLDKILLCLSQDLILLL